MFALHDGFDVKLALWGEIGKLFVGKEGKGGGKPGGAGVGVDEVHLA